MAITTQASKTSVESAAKAPLLDLDLLILPARDFRAWREELAADTNHSAKADFPLFLREIPEWEIHSQLVSHGLKPQTMLHQHLDPLQPEAH